jgi:hypothetical protein
MSKGRGLKFAFPHFCKLSSNIKLVAYEHE